MGYSIFPPTDGVQNLGCLIKSNGLLSSYHMRTKIRPITYNLLFLSLLSLSFSTVFPVLSHLSLIPSLIYNSNMWVQQGLK